MAAILSNALWPTLTTGHPLWQDSGSFPFAFLCTHDHLQERAEQQTNGEQPR